MLEVGIYVGWCYSNNPSDAKYKQFVFVSVKNEDLIGIGVEQLTREKITDCNGQGDRRLNTLLLEGFAQLQPRGSDWWNEGDGW